MKKGFTLIELLVVIAIIAILAGIVIIAVNPAHQIALARNAQRRADVLTDLNAIHQFFIDNGKFPRDEGPPVEEIDTTPRQLGTNTTDCNITCKDKPLGEDWTTDANCLDLSAATALVPTYVSAIPKDPQGADTATGYAVKKDATTNRITVRACLSELRDTVPVIEVTR